MDVAARQRAYIRVSGTDARTHLQNMVSNDVEALEVGEACPALLLTAKARVVAPVVVLRCGEEDYLVLTEPELGETVRALLVRMRLRLQCEIELEEHSSVVVFDGSGFASDFATELVDAALEPTVGADELERRRIESRVPKWGREIDDRVLPAEAGLEATHVSFAKGCYPGQEPIARQHYRGKVNRSLRVVELDEVPPYDAELAWKGKVVGRVTSAVRRDDGSVLALAFVRVEVPDDAVLELVRAAA